MMFHPLYTQETLKWYQENQNEDMEFDFEVYDNTNFKLFMEKTINYLINIDKSELIETRIHPNWGEYLQTLPCKYNVNDFYNYIIPTCAINNFKHTIIWLGSCKDLYNNTDLELLMRYFDITLPPS
jgi:hypothetical protein